MPIIEEPESLVDVVIPNEVIRKSSRKSLGKQISMVIYRHGVRVEVGKAIVNDDGSIEAQITKDAWPEIKEYVLPKIGEFSLVPAPATSE